jgi:hypothetical protein
MEIRITMSCGCEWKWHDLDVPPVLNAPCHCEAHGDVEIKDVSVTGVADFFIRDMSGNWWHYGEIISDEELALMLAPLVEGEDYDTFPAFTRSVPPALIIKMEV